MSWAPLGILQKNANARVANNNVFEKVHSRELIADENHEIDSYFYLRCIRYVWHSLSIGGMAVFVPDV